MKTVVVVHTGPATLQPIKQQFEELLPEVRVVNLMDDSLLNDAIAAGGLTDAVSGRILSYLQVGEAMGASVLLNACSSVREAATKAAGRVSVPIVKIDDAMAEQAVALGTRIGVVATVRTTLEPTVRLVRAKAEAAGKTVEVVEALAEGAFEALLSGRADRHDELLRSTVQSLAGRVDVIVLAQASMARLVPALADLGVPVLSSPRSGVESVRRALAALA